jgi:hypothetical protein
VRKLLRQNLPKNRKRRKKKASRQKSDFNYYFKINGKELG